MAKIYIQGILFATGGKKYKKETGVSLTAHQLRHAYATMLFEAGIDEKDAQELMGHSDINLTRSIYTHQTRAKRENRRGFKCV